jgi:hypothetical protein
LHRLDCFNLLVERLYLLFVDSVNELLDDRLGHGRLDASLGRDSLVRWSHFLVYEHGKMLYRLHPDGSFVSQQLELMNCFS